MFRSVLTAAFAAVVISASMGGAATLKYTEGKRPQVDGTVKTGPTDAPSTGPGFIVIESPSTLGFGAADIQSVDIYGRMVNAVDVFSFTASSSFTVSFIFDGYSVGGTPVSSSGYVIENSGTNTGRFALTEGGGAVVSASYTTDYTADTPGALALIFTAGPGDYILSVDGNGKPAYYDLRVAAVPLPAGVLLLMSALAGLGLARHRRRQTA